MATSKRVRTRRPKHSDTSLSREWRINMANEKKKVIVLQIIKAPYQCDSMCRVCDVCEGICNRMILHFSYYCEYRVWFFVMTGQALLMSPKGRSASMDGLVKILEGLLLFAILLLCEITTSFV